MDASPDLDGLAALALDALRDPLLLVDCDHPRRIILSANLAARSLFHLESFPKPIAEIADLIAPQSAGDLNQFLTCMGNGVPAASRVLAWRFGAHELTRNTEFRALAQPGRHLIAITLPYATPSDRRLLMLTKTAPNVLSIIDNDGQYRYIGDGFQRVLGYSTGERLNAEPFDLVHPDDIGRAQEEFQKVASGRVERSTCEIRVLHKNGSYCWLETTMISAVDDPEIQGIVVNARDVTERKRSFNFLAQTERVARTGGWDYDPETKQLHWSDELYRIFETSPEKFKPTLRGAIARLLPHARRKLSELRIANVALSQPIDTEIEINTFAGNRRWVRLVINVDYSGVGGRPYGAVQNIQTRKEAQLARDRTAEWLKLSMKLNHMIAWRWERGPDEFEFVGPKGNPEFLSTSFHGMQDLLSRTHPEDRTRFTQGIERALIDGGDLKQEFRWRGCSHNYRWYVVAAEAIRDAEGKITGFVGATQDITDRKELEREILEIANREQQRIGNDLHDGLGQELTGVALMLRALATKIQRENPGAVANVNEIVGLVNQSIESAHSLASGLSPVSANRGGLIFALRALAARSRDQYGVEVRFRSRVWPQIMLDEAGTGHLYRIAQEALANATKHGRASQIGIQFRANADTFALSIEDNGIGLGSAADRSSGMGLKIMAYRASMIGAKLEFLPNEPSGTIVRISGEQPKQE